MINFQTIYAESDAFPSNVTPHIASGAVVLPHADIYDLQRMVMYSRGSWSSRGIFPVRLEEIGHSGCNGTLSLAMTPKTYRS